MGNKASQEIEKELNKSVSAKPTSPNRKLAEHLGKKLLTIVVIGSTGAGKSTWINTFISSLEKRKYKDERLVAISQHFMKVTQVCNIKEFTRFQNERVSSQSEAQTTGCNVYRIITDTHLISISDTPGLEESQVEDNSHIKSIVEHVEALSEINCIVYVHNDTGLRATEKLKEMINKYFVMLTPQVIADKLVVCLTHINNVMEDPKSVETLRKFGVVRDFPPTKCFTFKNDNWLDSKVAEGIAKVNHTGAKLEKYLRDKADDWDANMEQHQKFLEEVAQMDPPVFTEKLFLTSKLKEAVEDFISNSMDVLHVKSSELHRARQTKEHLTALIDKAESPEGKNLNIAYPVKCVFQSVFTMENSEKPLIFSKVKLMRCEIQKDDIDRGWFFGHKGDAALECCGGKKSEHCAIDFKLEFNKMAHSPDERIVIRDPLLLGYVELPAPLITAKEDYTRLVIVYLKDLLKVQVNKEIETIRFIKTVINDCKTLELLRDQSAKDLKSMIIKSHLDVYKEFQTEINSKETEETSQECESALREFIQIARKDLFDSLEDKFAIWRPYEIKKQLEGFGQ